MAELTLVRTPPLPPQDDLDAQEAAFWTTVADAVVEALAAVHPAHPKRGELCHFATVARRAAGLPSVHGIED